MSDQRDEHDPRMWEDESPMKPWPSVEAMEGVVAGADKTFEETLRHTPRSSVDLAMERTADAALDHRAPAEVARGENPFVQAKEAVMEEIVSSKYSLRRSALLHPERGRMIVARVEFNEQLGSIFLPQPTQRDHTDNNMEVVVLACGPLRFDPSTGREVKMEYSPEQVIGRHAIVRRHSGIEFMWWNENAKEYVCYLIGQSEIWAWLDVPPGCENEMQNSPELQKTLRYITSGLAQKQITAGEPAAICGFHVDWMLTHPMATAGKIIPYCVDATCPYRDPDE